MSQATPAADRGEFVTVPETALPGGLVVPSFRAGKYLAARGADGLPVSVADLAPWVRIDYHEARRVADAAGTPMIADSQSLALAYQIALQPANWTGGRVGVGKLYQGLRKGRVSSAQPATYESPDPDERRWFELPGGQRIYDVAGNAFSWVFDDIQGDENGLVARPFAADSPSIVIPYPAEEKGQGWTPRAGAGWSGAALVRAGCWRSGRGAGAFDLGYGWPDYRYVGVAVRCTLPGL